MNDKEKAKQRMAILKRLRQEHADTVKRTQELLKEQKAFRKQMEAAMKGGPKTIPEIASVAELPSDQVLWHVMAMKKYDLLREVGQDAEYYQYQLTEEVAK